MATACAFGVIRVNHPTAHRSDRCLDKPAFIQGIGMNGDLNIHLIRDTQTRIDRLRRRPPVLVEFEPDRARFDLLAQGLGPADVALAGKTDIHRECIRRLQHPLEVPGTRCHSRRIGASGGTGATANHRGDTARQCFVDLLRTNEVNVGIDPTSGQNHAFASNDLGRGTNWNGDRRLNIRIACLADTPDPARLKAHIGFHDPKHGIDDQRIRDHGVGDFGSHALALPHAVADDLAAPELDLFAVDRVVVFNLDHQIGVSQTHPVARGGPKHFRVSAARDSGCHDFIAPACPSPDLENPRLFASPPRQQVAPHAIGRAQSAPRCLRRCRGETPAQQSDQNRVPHWSQQSDSANPPGLAGHRYWSHAARPMDDPHSIQSRPLRGVIHPECPGCRC